MENTSQSFETMIGTLITTYLIDKYKLSNMYYGLIFGLIVHGVHNYGDVNTTVIIDLFWLYYKWGLLISACVYLMYYGFLKTCIEWLMEKQCFKLFTKKTETHVILKLYCPSYIETLTKYMKKYPDHFDKTYNLDYGTASSELFHLYYKGLTTRAKSQHVALNNNIEFKIKGITGYLVWKTYTDKRIITNSNAPPTEKTETYKYVVIYIEKKHNITGHEFYTILYKGLNGNTIKLYQYKIYKYDTYDAHKTRCCKFTMYEGIKKSVNDKEKIYMNSFFHIEKNRLWSRVRKLSEDPNSMLALGQPAQLNLLLHGPPGSGKSSFAYRIAMCLDRNVVNIDLRDITDRVQLNHLLRTPILNGTVTAPKNCIYVFDISIKYLLKQTEIFNLKQKIAQANYEQYKNTLCNANDDNKIPQKMNEDIPFQIADLLDIFQGTVPNTGAIIIATTNDYHGIKNECPALFRPGRLTPVYFGYIDKNVFKEIVQFYFKQEFKNEIKIENVNTPTSEIIDIAIECVSNTDVLLDTNYSTFLEKIDKLLN